jgi:hypothetical protein
VNRARRSEFANWLGVALAAVSVVTSGVALWLVLR